MINENKVGETEETWASSGEKGPPPNYSFEYRGINHVVCSLDVESKEAFMAGVVEKYRSIDAGETRPIPKPDRQTDLRTDFQKLENKLTVLADSKSESALSETADSENAKLRAEVIELRGLFDNMQNTVAEMNSPRNGAAPKPVTKEKKEGESP